MAGKSGVVQMSESHDLSSKPSSRAGSSHAHASRWAKQGDFLSSWLGPQCRRHETYKGCRSTRSVGVGAHFLWKLSCYFPHLFTCESCLVETIWLALIMLRHEAQVAISTSSTTRKRTLRTQNISGTLERTKQTLPRRSWQWMRKWMSLVLAARQILERLLL